MLKRLLSCILSALLVFSFAACQHSAAGASIAYEVDTVPTNLDPQLAFNACELMVIRNAFEGLLREDDNGKIVPAAAESMDVSADGTTYTFHLRSGIQWSNGTPVTAADFVFGLERAVTPDTAAPFASTLFPIVNAEEINTGALPATDLGVTAPDKDTVRITLAAPDADFPRVLTTAIAMPCNQDFFNECMGQYGLTEPNIISDGPFFVYDWVPADHISLRNNSYYTGPFTALPASVSIFYNADTDDQQSRVSRISAGNIDAGIIPSDEEKDAKAAGLPVTAFQNTCYCLMLNPGDNGIADTNIRQALAAAIGRDTYRENLPDHFAYAEALVPPSDTVDDINFRNAVGPSSIPDTLSADAAASLYADTIKAHPDEALSGITLLYPDDPDIKTVVSYIAQSWQVNLGIYVDLQAASLGAIQSDVKGGSYVMAVMPVSSPDNTAQGFLGQFVSGSALNTYGFSDTQFDHLMTAVTPSMTDNEASAALYAAEEELCGNNQIIPLFYDSICFTGSKTLSGMYYSPSGGYCSFFNAVKAG